MLYNFSSNFALEIHFQFIQRFGFQKSINKNSWTHKNLEKKTYYRVTLNAVIFNMYFISRIVNIHNTLNLYILKDVLSNIFQNKIRYLIHKERTRTKNNKSLHLRRSGGGGFFFY